MKSSLFLISILSTHSVIAQQRDTLFTAEEAVQEALKNNLQIEISRKDLEAAQLNNSWAMAGRWPSLNATVSDVESVTNLNQKLSNGSEISRDGALTNNFTANLVFNWRVFQGFRVKAAKERLEEFEKIGSINLEQQMAVITFDVLVNYYNLVRLNRQVIATQAIIDLNKERTLIADTRFNVGTAAKTDFLQASIDLNEQKVNLEQIYSQIDLTKARLNTLLKRDPRNALGVTDTSFKLNTIDTVVLARSMREKNYDLLRAQSELAVLIQEKKEINSQRIPFLNLSSVTSFNRNKSDAGFFLSNQTFGPNLGLSLGIPIYNGNIFKTQSRINDVQQKTQSLVIENLANEVTLQLNNSYVEYLNAMKTVTIEEKNLDLASENNFISTERFKKAQGNSIELRQAQLSLVDAQYRLINAQFRAKLAEINMLLLAGEITEAF
jgi:outer membrane protein